MSAQEIVGCDQNIWRPPRNFLLHHGYHLTTCTLRIPRKPNIFLHNAHADTCHFFFHLITCSGRSTFHIEPPEQSVPFKELEKRAKESKRQTRAEGNLAPGLFVTFRIYSGGGGGSDPEARLVPWKRFQIFPGHVGHCFILHCLFLTGQMKHFLLISNRWEATKGVLDSGTLGFASDKTKGLARCCIVSLRHRASVCLL